MSNTIDQRIHRRPTEQLRPRPVRRPAEPDPATDPVDRGHIAGAFGHGERTVGDDRLDGENRGQAVTGLIFRVLLGIAAALILVGVVAEATAEPIDPTSPDAPPPAVLGD